MGRLFWFPTSGSSFCRHRFTVRSFPFGKAETPKDEHARGPCKNGETPVRQQDGEIAGRQGGPPSGIVRLLPARRPPPAGGRRARPAGALAVSPMLHTPRRSLRGIARTSDQSE